MNCTVMVLVGLAIMAFTNDNPIAGFGLLFLALLFSD